MAALFVVTGARRLRRETAESIEQVQRRQGIPVDVVKAQVVPVEDWREFTGVAQGTEQVDLMSDYRSRVSKVHVRVGQPVKRGTVIVSFDAFDPVRFATNYQTLRAAYEAAQKDSARVEELYKTGAVSDQELERVRASTQAARSAFLMSSRAVNLDTPIDGVVTATYVEEGEYADAGQVVATVAKLERIKVPLQVSATERALIRVGQRARIPLRTEFLPLRSCDTLGVETSTASSVEGFVTKAALSADQSSRLFSVEVVIDNPGQLIKPGMLVPVQILVGLSQDLPALPPAAIVRRNGSEAVFVVVSQGDSSKALVRPIQRAVSTPRLVSVAQGINPGELVVVAGHTRLEDGVKVLVHADRTPEYYGQAGG